MNLRRNIIKQCMNEINVLAVRDISAWSLSR